MFTRKKVRWCAISILLLISLAHGLEDHNSENSVQFIDDNQILELNSRILSQDATNSSKNASEDDTDDDDDADASDDDQLEPLDPNNMDDTHSKSDDTDDAIAQEIKATNEKADPKKNEDATIAKEIKTANSEKIGGATIAKEIKTANSEKIGDSTIAQEIKAANSEKIGDATIAQEIKTANEKSKTADATGKKDTTADDEKDPILDSNDDTDSDSDDDDDSDADDEDNDYDEYLAEPLFVVDKKPNKPSESQSSFGFRGFMLVLILFTFAYCLVRVFINMYYLGHKGQDAIPHRELIRESPKLLRDGIMYSKDVAQETYSKIHRSFKSRALSERGKSTLFGNGYTNV